MRTTKGWWLAVLAATHTVTKADGLFRRGHSHITLFAASVPPSPAAFEARMQAHVASFCADADLAARCNTRLAPEAVSFPTFRMEELDTPELGRALCAALKEWRFVVIRLAPDSAEAEQIRQSFAWGAERFHSLATEDKLRLSGAFRAGPEASPGTVLGFVAPSETNHFLETRRGPEQQLEPVTLDQRLPGDDERQFSVAAALGGGWDALASVAHAALHAVEQATGREVGSLAGLMDDGSNVVAGQVSSTALRVCRYQSSPPVLDDDTAGERIKVAFGAHTDSTFFTAIPCASTPGLEVHHPRLGWVTPEGGSRSHTDVVLMAGEFLQVLTDGDFDAAVHRVLEPEADASSVGRLSTPLLLRGHVRAVLPDAPGYTTAAELHQMLLRLTKEEFGRLHEERERTG